MKTALIDADILAYQAASYAEKPVNWGDGLWTLHAFEADAEHKFTALVQNVIDKVEADEVILALSDSANWRKDVLATYKANRAGTRKPMLLPHLREFATTNYKVYQRDTLEGDDCLGILSTMRNKMVDPIVCSLDKDFKTIPGKHYNFGKDEFFEITDHQADYWHMMQTLMGDSTDGYAGCPGIGAVTAAKILQKAVDEGTPWANREQLNEIYWKHVVAAYDKAGLSEEEALVQARVARICRADDYDFNTRKVILWEPYGNKAN
jgi:5'-3' exonuclease